MNRSLIRYLSAQLDREVQREEVAFALGASISTLTRRQRDGFLADEVIAASRHFGISPVTALIDLGYVTPEELAEVSSGRPTAIGSFTDVELAEEIMRRARGPVSEADLTLAALDSETLVDEIESHEEQP